jgi:hypothetical protein
MGLFGSLFGNGWESINELPSWVRKAKRHEEYYDVGKIYKGRHFEYKEGLGTEVNGHGGNDGNGSWKRRKL